MESLDSIDFGNAFFTENVVSMRSMFSHTAVKNLDLSCFNTENVTDMSHMFDNCDAVFLDISSFDTSNVIYFWNMFGHMSNVQEINLGDFNTENAEYCQGFMDAPEEAWRPLFTSGKLKD